MCVALPGRVVSVREPSGRSRPAVVRFGSRDLEIDLILVPEAAVGDYVVAHAGFALSVVSAAEAEKTLALMSPDDDS